MDSKEIISNINSIYDRFKIPQNLRVHMYKAAAVCEMICDNWKGPRIRKQDIIATSLVHDLGNIIKMNFNTKLQMKMMGIRDPRKLEHWKRVKKWVISRYGTGEHEITTNMLRAIGAENRIMKYVNNESYLFRDRDVGDWDQEIFWYGDHRSGPFGIISLRMRIRDIKSRYKSYYGHFTKKQLQKRISNIFSVERQIFKHVSITPRQINDRTIEPYLKKYQNL